MNLTLLAVTSSDLSRYYDQSSWFFRKAVAERARQPVLCVAPGAYDKLIVVRGVDYVVAEIKNVISEVLWGLHSHVLEIIISCVYAMPRLGILRGFFHGLKNLMF